MVLLEDPSSRVRSGLAFQNVNHSEDPSSMADLTDRTSWLTNLFMVGVCDRRSRSIYPATTYISALWTDRDLDQERS